MMGIVKVLLVLIGAFAVYYDDKKRRK